MADHQPFIPCSHQTAICITSAHTLQSYSKHYKPRLRTCVTSCCEVRVTYACPYLAVACQVCHTPCLLESPTSTRQAWFQCLSMWSADSTYAVNCMAGCCSACQCGCQWQSQHTKLPTHAKNHGEIVGTPPSCPVIHVHWCHTPQHCHMFIVAYAPGGKLNSQPQQQINGSRTAPSPPAKLGQGPGHLAATLQARRERC